MNCVINFIEYHGRGYLKNTTAEVISVRQSSIKQGQE